MNMSADGTGDAIERDTAGHWREIARQWQEVGPPLRPAAQDVGFCIDAVQERLRDRPTSRVLLLGVTPELYRLPWPEGTDFLAVDHTRAMIDAVWPGPRKAALCTDWLDLTLPHGSRDIVLCDGGLHLLPYPHDQRRLVHVIRGVLSHGGLCIFRLFLPPPERESPDAVLDDLLKGRISNLNILKFRLWMSLMKSAAEGVELAAVWRAIHSVAQDLEGLAARIGWRVEHMLAINTYRNSTARYYFATIDEIRDLFCGGPGGFEVRRLYVPSYQLGRQCPTIVFERRSSAP